MKRLVLLGVGLLVVLTLVSVVGAASAPQCTIAWGTGRAWLTKYEVAQGGARGLAVKIYNTARININYIGIQFKDTNFKVDQAIAVAGTAVDKIENSWTSAISLKGDGLQAGKGVLIIHVSKPGATPEDYNYYIKNPNELIYRMFGLQLVCK